MLERVLRKYGVVWATVAIASVSVAISVAITTTVVVVFDLPYKFIIAALSFVIPVIIAVPILFFYHRLIEKLDQDYQALRLSKDGQRSFLGDAEVLLDAGMEEEFALETGRRVALLKGLSIGGILVMVVFVILAFIQNNIRLALVDLTAVCLLTLNLIHLFIYRRYNINLYFGVICTAIFFLYLFITGGTNNSAFVWYYVFPLIAAFLLGNRKGSVATFLVMIPVIILFLVDNVPPYFATYSADFKVRFIPSLFLVYVFSYLFESTRERVQQQLAAKNMELARAQNSLEQRVEERTGELAIANKQLLDKITEQQTAAKQRRALESQLMRAQKMEAVGTLAGGVAHDLNNVLAGIVSFPQLLLMELPEDSPLREDILTMKQSGEKAAAIVQDLLTLARRGVSVAKVVNLNKIIKIYLDSPEQAQIMRYNSGVKVEATLDPFLLNLSGSSLHLSKTIMNLISNAVEAMPKAGVVRISTTNRYVDRPLAGYDDVAEGDYVVLTVGDEGQGISDKDLPNIFEPFYSKKVMGRSGTGLGLAVVWGTVKDHGGYIDVQSAKGKGTTFQLYFPATRQEESSTENAFSLDAYRGQKESILVVDDVVEQRRIATKVFEALGYHPVAVAGGEEAIAYVSKTPVDLIVLDMIMDPGIDGLETYRRILEIRPTQKVVIVSGFAETERVRLAIELGAKAYVKKPYIIESIAPALREALDG